MAAPTRTPRASWVEEGLRALGLGGPDAVRIEKLAQTLGVTKGGFYWHFEGRGALLEEMLDAWERLVIDEVIERVEAGGGDARAKLARLSDEGTRRARSGKVLTNEHFVAPPLYGIAAWVDPEGTLVAIGRDNDGETFCVVRGFSHCTSNAAT